MVKWSISLRKVYADVTIFRASLLTFLDDFERIEADDGYIGESPFRAKVPKAVLSCPSEADAFQKKVQERHETINVRLKFFAILEDRFRHDITQHGYVFPCFSLAALSRLFRC